MELFNESRTKKYYYDYIIPLQHFQNILKQTKNKFPTWTEVENGFVDIQNHLSKNC